MMSGVAISRGIRSGVAISSGDVFNVQRECLFEACSRAVFGDIRSPCAFESRFGQGLTLGSTVQSYTLLRGVLWAARLEVALYGCEFQG